MLTTLGYLLTGIIIIPLTLLDINDNVILQLVSWAYNFIFLFTILGMSASLGATYSIPAVGSDQSQVIGAVLFNFAMANTIPSVKY